MDGEFSRQKDALKINLERRDTERDGHIEVVDSETFTQFGKKYLSQPGPKSGIKKRKFYHLDESVVKARIAEKPSFKTLNGINSVFQYICKPSGEVMWRKLPCFCSSCSDMLWENCKCRKIVGSLKIVIQSSIEF